MCKKWLACYVGLEDDACSLRLLSLTQAHLGQRCSSCTATKMRCSAKFICLCRRRQRPRVWQAHQGCKCSHGCLLAEAVARPGAAL
jgi:hypothetical protein